MKFKDYLIEGVEYEYEEEIVEKDGASKAVKKIKIDSKGKKIVKWKCPAEGYEKDKDNEKRCVKTKMSDLKKRKLGAKKRFRKIKGKMGKIQAKIAKAKKKRASRGL